MPAREVAPVIFFGGKQTTAGSTQNPVTFAFSADDEVDTEVKRSQAIHPSQRRHDPADDLAPAANQGGTEAAVDPEVQPTIPDPAPDAPAPVAPIEKVQKDQPADEK